MPSPFDAANLRAFFRMGVPVSFRNVASYPDGSPIQGLFDRPVAMHLQEEGIGGVETAAPELRLPFNAFATMPQSGDTIVVQGTTYLVDQPTQEDDGAIYCYTLHQP